MDPLEGTPGNPSCLADSALTYSLLHINEVLSTSPDLTPLAPLICFLFFFFFFFCSKCAYWIHITQRQFKPL